MRVLITGGAGYIGSLLTGSLLAAGNEVVVVDTLLFGGYSVLAYFFHPLFRFRKADVTTDDLSEDLTDVDVVYHMAALVGFPVCQAVGEDVAYRFNRDATRLVFEAAEKARVTRFIFASTYSNYGIAADSVRSPRNPSCIRSLCTHARRSPRRNSFSSERNELALP